MTSKDLEKANSTELTTEIDPYEAAAISMEGDSIRTLKFIDGDYFLGLDAEEVPLGSRVIISMKTMLLGRTCWKSGEPVAEAMRLVSEGPPPALSELPDHGPYDEDAREGWQLNVSAEMVIEETGEQVLFRSNSKGGIRAMSGLARAYGRKRQQAPNIVPIAELGWDSYFNKHFSKTIKYPVFGKVVWKDETELAGNGSADPAAAPVPGNDGDPGPDGADDVPFTL